MVPEINYELGAAYILLPLFFLNNNFNFQDVHRHSSLYLHVNINCQVVYSEWQSIFHIFLYFCNAVKEEIVSIHFMVIITAKSLKETSMTSDICTQFSFEKPRKNKTENAGVS